MEKKANHFVRLLAKKLNEKEHEQSRVPTDIATVKQTFRNALNDLPKSPLKSELQGKAATYSRKLEALTKNGRSGNTKSINKGQKVQHESGEPTMRQDDKDLVTNDLRSSQMRREEARAPSSPKRSKKPPRKCSPNAHSSDSAAKDDGSDEERTDDTVAMATQSVSKMDVTSQHEPDGASASQSSSFAYNVCAKDAKSRVLESLAQLPSEERQRLAPHAYACLCSSNSFSEFLHSLQPDDKLRTTSDTMGLLQQEVLAGLGTSDAKVLIRTMADCLSGVILEADKVLETKDSSRLMELQGFILNFLQWAKMQHEFHGQKRDKQSQSLTNFEDLMAAILSIYVDISIVLSRNNPDTAEAEGRSTLSKILLLIGQSPIQQLNLLLQVTQPSARDCRFMMPIYKQMLMAKPSVMTNEAFIKYVCAVRFSRQVLREQTEPAVQDVLRDISNVAATAEPSIEFLQWLYSVAPDAYSSLPDSVKSTASLLVKYLTEQASRDYLDKLLDIVCDEENESQTLSYKDGRGDQSLPVTNSHANQADILETEGLFFKDTSRDEDLAQQVNSDPESVDALHSRLDELIEGIDQEDTSEDDENEEDVVVKPSNTKARSKFSSIRNGGDGNLTPSDSDDQSDYDEVDMDLSGTTSEQTVPESLSFEEQRYMLKSETQKATDASGAAKSDVGSTQRRRGKSRSQKTLSLSSKGDEEDVIVIPETQGYQQETESDRESFTTAKDNLDSTRESIVIDVDDEITFKVKASRHKAEEDGEVAEEDAGEEEEEMDDEDEIHLIENEADDDDQDEENDSGKGKDTSGQSCSETSPLKAQTRRLHTSQESGKTSSKKQEQVSDESNGGHKGMNLRSMSNARSQSSLLRFFTPISRNNEDSDSDSQPTRGTESGKHSQTDDVEVVPDSCSSADNETRSTKTDNGTFATPRRAKNLDSLQGVGTDSNPEESADASQPREKKNTAPATKKQNRLSRSARKTGSARKRMITSSDSDEEPARLPSPVFRRSKAGKQASKTSEQMTASVEDAVSKDNRQMQKECETASSDLQHPIDTEESTHASQPREEKDTTPGLKKHSRLSGSVRKVGSVRKRMVTSSDSDKEPAIPHSPVFRQSKTSKQASKTSEQKTPAVQDAVSEGIRRIREECATTSLDLGQPLVTRSASKKKQPKRKSLTITGGIKTRSLAVSTPRQPTKGAQSSTPAEKTASKSAEKRQGVSPLSPSKVKRAATFGDTYRILAGISADSQTDPGSLPASQSQKTSSKMPRLQPKALEEMFDKDTPSGRKQSAKKQTADVQVISGSSQESTKSKNDSPTERISKKTVARTPKSSQESSVSTQAKRLKKAKSTNDSNSPKAALKRRASLPSKEAMKSTKMKRKSTGTKT
ncbi:dentin sialophosphoprotein-like [Patiria miniata]|uniref:Uncharacterized protein n=1 Tax=Patiria miniata TaxID=46514 RepID=A0A913ZVE6_PATMI|nr:dentin sialophosphoprotein-like [Patiria miniata]